MLYFLIHGFIAIILILIGLFVFLKKIKKHKKSGIIIFVLSAFLVWEIVLNVPFELPFIRFSSAKDACNYSVTAQLLQTMEGNNFTMALFKDRNNTRLLIPVYRDERGWISPNKMTWGWIYEDMKIFI